MDPSPELAAAHLAVLTTAVQVLAAAGVAVVDLGVRRPTLDEAFLDTVAVIVFPLAFPLTAVANVFVTPQSLPGWLGTVAEWNPISATVAACRELFGNPGVGGDSWVAGHAIAMAVAWPLLLIVVFAPLAIRRYQRLSR